MEDDADKLKNKAQEPISILLIEDDEVDIMNVQRAFLKNGMTNPLHIAHNGQEALNMLRGNAGEGSLNPRPTVILLDINMPRMNGIEFLKEIRADESLKSISVFVMTTSNEESDKIEAYKLNVAGYILKPLSFERFIEAVKTLNHYWNLTNHNGFE